MIPTYTNEYRSGLILEYLSFNLVTLLIYRPNLGYTDTPTLSELQARQSLTMSIAASAEIGSTSLNGYKRQLVTLTEPISPPEGGITMVQATTAFTANGGSIGPFTHIVIARGADLRSISVSNGNNRGSNTGTVIFVEPVTSSPLTLEAPYTYQHSFSLAISTKAIS